MASPSYTQDLLEKIRSLPDDKIAEVADFVDFLHARRRSQADAPDAVDALEAQAAAAGLIRLPDPQARKLSPLRHPQFASAESLPPRSFSKTAGDTP